VPNVALDAAAEAASRLPLAPDSVSWLHALRKPVLMKTDRARNQLGWRPKHSSRATLRATVEARRAEPAEG
jgi:UDP-glucose 4-epimerase